MAGRRSSRKHALQALYLMDMRGVDPGEALEQLFDALSQDPDFDPDRSDREFTDSLVYGVHRERERIDARIDAASEHWRVARMAVIDRSILRIAVFEMMFREDVPARVSVNEAVELGKRFSSNESASFINGVLDHLLAKLHGGESGEKGGGPE